MFRKAVTALITLSLLSLLSAQLVRDRGLLSMLLMCLPPWPLALVAVVWDARLRGHAWRPRWLLGGVAIVAAAWSLAMTWSPARAPEGLPTQRLLRVVQWNTQWGGKRREGAAAALMDALDAQGADIVCLSEAPARENFDPGWSARHPTWHTLTVENTPRPSYSYRLTLTSRHPIRLVRETDLETGHTALFNVDVPGMPLRVMMVDLESMFTKRRTPSLEQLGRELAKTPVDLLLGDFNATSRFRGFDAIAANGYRRAALWSGAWRATWPSVLPLLDIDHVWVRGGLDIVASHFFRSAGIDHRGQRTSLRAQ